MEKDKKSEIHITNNFNAPIGQHIDHVDTINFRMDGEGNFQFGMVENANNINDEVKKTVTKDRDTPLVEELKPIFYNNEKDVREFLKLIKGMEPNDITDLVNKWVTEKRISDYGYSRKGQLWKILHDAGLYDKTQQNWNRRVQ